MKKVMERIPAEMLERCRAARREVQETHFAAAEKKLGKEATDALRDLYALYDERIYIWLAGLWDPEIGGFYFSESGRDTKGLLPDIESTAQALRCLSSNGMFGGKGYASGISIDMKKKLCGFVCSLEDPRDGYFYHPQWGKAITISRRGRDISWATGMLSELGARAPYPTAIDRLKEANSEDGEKSSVLPEHLCDPEKFRSYLAERDLSRASYFIGNQLQAQAPEICAAGSEYIKILMDWLEENQREDNGLWQQVVNYDSVNGLMKLGLIYSSFGIPIPRAEKALESTISAALSDQKITFVCQFYNPLVTICNLLRSVGKTQGEERREELRAQLIKSAPELLRRTREKVLCCRSMEYEGVYRYHEYGSKSGGASQGMAVGLRVYDDDINGCTIALNGVIPNVCDMLGIPKIPVFTEADGELFNYLIKTAEQYPKVNEYPGDEYYYNYDTPFAREIRANKEKVARGEL